MTAWKKVFEPFESLCGMKASCCERIADKCLAHELIGDNEVADNSTVRV